MMVIVVMMVTSQPSEDLKKKKASLESRVRATISTIIDTSSTIKPSDV
jgi:hypothetical protein